MTMETFLKYLQRTPHQGSRNQPPPTAHGRQWQRVPLLSERCKKSFTAKSGKTTLTASSLLDFQLLHLKTRSPETLPASPFPASNQKSWENRMGNDPREHALLPGGGEREWQRLGLHRQGAGYRGGFNWEPRLCPSPSAPVTLHPYTHPEREALSPAPAPAPLCSDVRLPCSDDRPRRPLL